MELGFVIVTHGGVGEELLRVASYILGGRLRNVRTVRVPFMGEGGDFPFHGAERPFAERRQWLADQIVSAAGEVEQGLGVVVLTDLLGGTAFSLASRILPPEKCMLVAGVNLPMLLKIPSLRAMHARQAAAELKERSRQAIESRAPQPFPEAASKD